MYILDLKNFSYERVTKTLNKKKSVTPLNSSFLKTNEYTVNKCHQMIKKKISTIILHQKNIAWSLARWKHDRGKIIAKYTLVLNCFYQTKNYVTLFLPKVFVVNFSLLFLSSLGDFFFQRFKHFSNHRIYSEKK